MSDIALKEPGVESAVAFPGLSINGFINSPSAGIVFVTLKPFDERRSSDLSGLAIAQKLQQSSAAMRNAMIAIFPPPPVQGLGTIGGFKLQVEDRTDQGDAALDRAMKDVQHESARRRSWRACSPTSMLACRSFMRSWTAPRPCSLVSTFRMCSTRCKTYLGSIYVNDFNRFGRTYQVIAQADTQFRSQPEDILRLQTRNADGQMVPLGAIMNV